MQTDVDTTAEEASGLATGAAEPLVEQARLTPSLTPALERRGRWWLVLSFIACPCHLPFTLGFLVLVFGGTALGAAVRDNAEIAGVLIAAVWVAGTARGMWLIRKGQRAAWACEVPG
jgi:mercuric ion transport protein